MRTFVLMLSLAATTAFGQYGPGSLPRAYGYSTSGFGSTLFPGGAPGHPVITGNITNPGFAGALGANVRGVPPGGGVAGRQGGGRAPVRSVIVPYPVYAYPYGYGYDQQQQVVVQQPQPQQPPVVIINQNYRPDTVNPQVRDYSDANLPQPTETLRRRGIIDDRVKEIPAPGQTTPGQP